MFTIYKIINLDNNRTYIGMTGDELKNRYSKHVRQMRSNTHFNADMQADWNDGHSFIVTKLTWRKDKAAAKALETKLMNLELQPYNVAMGNPGCMSGRMGNKFNDNNRSYMYQEIIALRGTPAVDLHKRFNISLSMISMIQMGHRVTTDPQTSFADVLFCDKTEVCVNNPAASEILSAYKELANDHA